MTIHHDKLAYGKISSLREDISEDRLIAMANSLSEQDVSPMPDYENSNDTLACSILKYFGVRLPQGGTTLSLADNFLREEKDNIAILLLDGMGLNVLRENLLTSGFFRSNLAGEYSSVFPAATVAATASVMSGMPPCRHGWLGWRGYFPEVDKNVIMFTNEDADEGGQAAPEHLANEKFPYRSVVDMINESGGNAYAVTPYSPPFPSKFSDLCGTMCDIMGQKGRKFVYAYWHEPDATMHENGVGAEKVKLLFAEIERETEKLFSSLRENTLLFITADHGHINAGTNVCIRDYPDILDTLLRMPSCEPRACSFFVKNGSEERFCTSFKKHFGEDFYLYKKEEVKASGLFGTGGFRAGADAMLGDYFAVAKGGVSIFNTREEAAKFKGVHGGLTEDELRIPLIALCK